MSRWLTVALLQMARNPDARSSRLVPELRAAV